MPCSAFPVQPVFRLLYRHGAETSRQGEETSVLANCPPSFEPALGRSWVLNDEAMDKVRLMLASSFNEWGETPA